MGYFKGNTRARRDRIAKLHKKFLARQRLWLTKRFFKHSKSWR